MNFMFKVTQKMGFSPASDIQKITNDVQNFEQYIPY